MDFNKPLKFHSNDYEIVNQKNVLSKTEKTDYPVRQIGDQFGLNYNLNPAAINISTNNLSK